MIKDSSDVLLRVENVSKRFCRSLKRSLWYGLQDLGSELGGGGSGLPLSSADVELRKDEFWAVKDVSFELRRGECLGLIGRNGAGKTTLLRMLNGLIKPDTGRIEMTGKIGAMIALGAGFNPVLTGRENIYTAASVLGLTKNEINSKFDEIVEFAEIPEFIDSPVQTFSSGMNVRLGFAIASTLEVDILLLDEVLAVGDAAFRGKCFNRMLQLLDRSAVIFVSHNMAQIGRICSDIGFMSRGGLKAYNHNLANGIADYNSDSSLVMDRCNTTEGVAKILNVSVDYSEDMQLGLFDKNIVSLNQQKYNEETINISITYESSQKIVMHPIAVLIDNELNNVVQIYRKAMSPSACGKNQCTLTIPAKSLGAGRYYVSCSLYNDNSGMVMANYQYCASFISRQTSGYAPIHL